MRGYFLISKASDVVSDLKLMGHHFAIVIFRMYPLLDPILPLQQVSHLSESKGGF